MKKKFLMLVTVACILVLAFALVACSNDDAGGGNSGGSGNSNEPIEDEQVVAIDDPEQFVTDLNLDVKVPGDSSSNVYSIVNSDTAQVVFYVDEMEYVYRVKATDKLEDISGIGGSFENTSEQEYGELKYTISYNQGGAGIATWYDEQKGTSNSLYIASGGSEEELNIGVTTVLMGYDY